MHSVGSPQRPSDQLVLKGPPVRARVDTLASAASRRTKQAFCCTTLAECPANSLGLAFSIRLSRRNRHDSAHCHRRQPRRRSPTATPPAAAATDSGSSGAGSAEETTPRRRRTRQRWLLHRKTSHRTTPCLRAAAGTRTPQSTTPRSDLLPLVARPGAPGGPGSSRTSAWRQGRRGRPCRRCLRRGSDH